MVWAEVLIVGGYGGDLNREAGIFGQGFLSLSGTKREKRREWSEEAEEKGKEM